MPERILQNTSATLSNTWYEDGVAVDPGTVTIRIDRGDGTTLVAAGTGTTGTGTTPRTYTLTTTHTALLDTLRVTWTSPTKGSVVTYAEIVGGFLFSIADARADSDLANPTTYPSAKIAEKRTLAETVLEDECGVAFVPRYSYETLSSRGGVHLPVAMRNLRSVRSASIDGTALTSAELAALKLSGESAVYHTSGWTKGWSNITVGYEHGMDYPPPDVSRACLLLAKHYLLKSPIDDRMTSMTTEDGTFSLVTPGVRGAVTGIPEVNATIQRYSIPDLVG